MKSSSVRIIGCQPQNSPVMARSVEAGKILELPSLPTLSDGSAGGIESGSITFEFCRRLVDRFILVSEEEIRRAVRFLLSEHGLVAEGSGALSVAAFIREKARFRGMNVVLILTGSRTAAELRSGKFWLDPPFAGSVAAFQAAEQRVNRARSVRPRDRSGLQRQS